MSKRLRLVIQLVVALLVIGMVARSLAGNWDRFRAVRLSLTPHAGWIGLSLVALALVSALQILSWRAILAGWGQSLRFVQATRIWFLANLGRYVPGKVWSVAGLVVLARQQGVQAWAAAASAVAVQALGLGTAAAVVAATVPGAASGLRLAAGAVVAAGSITLMAWPRAVAWLARRSGAARDWSALPVRTVLWSALLTAAGWVVYGLAFWLLARGLGLPDGLPVGTAMGVFALGYVLGLLALFAPGGVGVRELVYIGLLTPYVGSGGAIALSVASRLQLTLVEAAGGLGALFIGRHKEKDVRDAIRD